MAKDGDQTMMEDVALDSFLWAAPGIAVDYSGCYPVHLPNKRQVG